MHARNVCVLIQYTEVYFSEVLRCVCSTLPMKRNIEFWRKMVLEVLNKQTNKAFKMINNCLPKTHSKKRIWVFCEGKKNPNVVW